MGWGRAGRPHICFFWPRMLAQTVIFFTSELAPNILKCRGFSLEIPILRLKDLAPLGLHSCMTATLELSGALLQSPPLPDAEASESAAYHQHPWAIAFFSFLFSMSHQPYSFIMPAKPRGPCVQGQENNTLWRQTEPCSYTDSPSVRNRQVTNVLWDRASTCENGTNPHTQHSIDVHEIVRKTACPAAVYSDMLAFFPPPTH